MAMRVRLVDGVVVAVCAAASPWKAGDLYLDDAQDHAIRSKLAEDFNREGLWPLPQYEDEDRIRAAEEGRASTSTGTPGFQGEGRAGVAPSPSPTGADYPEADTQTVVMVVEELAKTIRAYQGASIEKVAEYAARKLADKKLLRGVGSAETPQDGAR